MTYQEINQYRSIENLPNETFKDIPGYEGYYQISNLGRIKSVNRIVYTEKRNGLTRTVKERILKQKIDKKKYATVHLLKNSKDKFIKIHRLVMLAFKGESKLEVNHIDGNKQNNRLDNLEYCTRSENIKHAYDNELKNNNSQKVKVKQFDKQGNFIKEYNSIAEAVKLLKVHQSGISNCLSGVYKSSFGFIWKKA
jgi:hypothetical protein